MNNENKVVYHNCISNVLLPFFLLLMPDTFYVFMVIYLFL